jgi:hypothetical protein
MTGGNRAAVTGGRQFSAQHGWNWSGSRNGHGRHGHGRHHDNKFAFFGGGGYAYDDYPYYYEPNYVTCERRRVRVNHRWVVQRYCWRPY